jgi:hypothetical protein
MSPLGSTRRPFSPFLPSWLIVAWILVLIGLWWHFPKVLAVLPVAFLVLNPLRTALTEYHVQASLSAVDCWVASEKARIDAEAAQKKAVIEQRAEYLRQLARDRPHFTYRYLKQTGWTQRYLPGS